MLDQEKKENTELSQVEKAELLVKQLDEQNRVYKELVERQEKAKVENMLGGRSISNQQTEKPKRELNNKEAALQFGKTFNLRDPMPQVDA